MFSNIINWILKKQDYFLIFFVILASIPLILPYLHAGYFPTHDGEWAVVRLADMFRTLRDFQIPARYSGNLNFGYGYPLFNFDYPFPYYFAVLFHFAKISFVDSMKITFAITIPLSAIGMYLFSKKLWGSSLGALTSSILYIYIPYRMVDLYVRGSIGECIAFAVAPFLFFSVYKVYTATSENIWVVVSAFLYAILITSHNIMAVLFSIPLGIFFLYLVFQNKKRLLPLLVSLVSGMLLSSFFMLPALFEKGNIILSKTPIADRSIYFVNLMQLVNSPWGYGVPADPKGAFTYQIGWGQIAMFVLIILAIATGFFSKNKDNFKLYLATIFAILIVLLSLLLFQESNIIWQNTPLLKEINYPWILIGIIGFLIASSTGFIFSNKIFAVLGLLLAAASIYLIYPNAHPSSYVDRGDNYYLTNQATTTSSNEVMPVWVTKMPTKMFESKAQIVKGDGKISNIGYKSNKVSFDFNSDSPAVVRVSEIYYPGWRAFSNGSEKAIFYNNSQGLMDIKLNSGNQNVQLNFSETPERYVADFISVTILVLLIIYSLKPSIFKLYKK